MKKRLVTCLLAICMVLSLLPVSAGAAAKDTVTFSDVGDRNTAVAVESLRLLGVLDGYGDGTFRPGTILTRAQFCKMAVYAMNGSEELGRYRTVTVFPDVKPSHWAAAYINMAAKGKGIISGYVDGQFHPDRTVTVGHAVTILLRMLGYKDEDIGGTMRIVPLKSENFRALRSQYMNPYIKPGSETASFGVLVDDKLIGVYAFSASPTLSNWDKHIETPTMYLLSDFPIAPTKYKRLAKLVLYAALSRESKLYAERLTNHRIRSLVTTAFTKRPVSMKYRGLFQLLNKKQLPGVDENETDMSKIYYNSGYQLNYGAPMGQWTLAEGLELWKKKHSQIGAKEDE